MSDAIKIAEQQLLAPGGLDQKALERVLSDLMGPAVDAGDLYFQTASHESWILEDGLVRSGSHSVEKGVGIRAISGDKTGFAYADDIVMPSLLQASKAARAIANQGSSGQVQAWRKTEASPLYQPEDPIAMFGAEEKVDLLRQIDTYARSRDSRVSEVVVSLAASHETVLIAASDGTFSADIRPLVRLNVSVIAVQ